MEKEKNIQRILIVSIICVGVILISMIAYLMNKRLNNELKQDFATEISEFNGESEKTSTDMGKTIEEAKSDYSFDFDTTEVIEEAKVEVEEKNEIQTNKVEEKEENVSEEQVKQEQKEESKEESAEVMFTVPIKGEILREYANESLVYSNTLQEWITHNGIDIKADKTSVVGSAAAGTVYAIKNDPRYGLTVIINHNNGYQTVYSNLLTAEFVVEGEEVSAGQTIGTVGNSSSFEIVDEYHLHFELLKDSEYLDPTIYINFE